MSDDEHVPPLGPDEFIHFEYLHFNAEDPQTGFSNYVDISRDRVMAQAKAYKLIADPNVYAIHIRRYEQPEQGVHLYDETQPVAKAQSQAFAERKRADTLQKLLGAAVANNTGLETHYEREVRGLEIRLAAMTEICEELRVKLGQILDRANADQRDAVYLDPGEIARMATVRWDSMKQHAMRRAKERAGERVEAEPDGRDYSPTISAGEGECESCGGPADHSEAACDGVDVPPESTEELHPCKTCGGVEDDHVGYALGHLYVGEGPDAQQLQERLTQAEATTQHLYDRNTLLTNVIDALREQFGSKAVEPIFKRVGLDHDLAKLRERVETEVAKGEVEQSPDDICVCEHPRKRHVAEGPEHGCHDCARDEYDHAFKLAQS